MVRGNEVVIELKTKGGRESEAQVNRLSDVVATKGRLMAAAFAGVGIAALAGATRFSQAALTQERAMNVLGRVVDNTGASFATMRGEIESTTAALQRKTNFGDEEQLQILSRMIPILGDVNKAMAALPAVLDAASASGRGASEVATTLTRALSGQANTAESVGITFDASADFGERLSLVMEKVGGAAEANADPFIQFNNALGDMQEAIGRGILPLATPLIKMFTDAGVAVGEFFDALGKGPPSPGDPEARQRAGFGTRFGRQFTSILDLVTPTGIVGDFLRGRGPVAPYPFELDSTEGTIFAPALFPKALTPSMTAAQRAERQGLFTFPNRQALFQIQQQAAFRDDINQLSFNPATGMTAESFVAGLGHPTMSSGGGLMSSLIDFMTSLPGGISNFRTELESGIAARRETGAFQNLKAFGFLEEAEAFAHGLLQVDDAMTILTNHFDNIAQSAMDAAEGLAAVTGGLTLLGPETTLDQLAPPILRGRGPGGRLGTRVNVVYSAAFSSGTPAEGSVIVDEAGNYMGTMPREATIDDVRASTPGLG